MSRYEYDHESELDDSLMFPKQSGKSRMHLDAETLIREMESQSKRESQRKALVDQLMGTRTHKWELSLAGGKPVCGEMVIPQDHYGDRALMTAFEKLFASIEVHYLGGTRFQAALSGRNLGSFDIGRSPNLSVDVWGRARYFDPEPFKDMERRAIKFLREKLELRLNGTEKYHAPYEPRMDKYARMREEARIKDDLYSKACHEIVHGKKAAKPKKGWVPVNEGAQNLAQGGVNLSLPSGGGAVNMAHVTQLQNTAVTGRKVDQMGNSGTLVRVDQVGKVIG